jgi:integrase
MPPKRGIQVRFLSEGPIRRSKLSNAIHCPALPSLNASYMSENTINAAIRGMGYSKEVMTAHGFRAMARTIMDEVLGERVDLIEHQLAHAVKDPNGRAYNRTAHLPARREMMQRWSDYLYVIAKDNNVIPGKFQRAA